MPKNTIPIVGHFPSIKLDDMVPFGSTIEADALYFFEFKKTINWYKAQPFTTTQKLMDGTYHQYTPDYEVHENDSTERYIVECKPDSKRNDEHTIQQTQLGKAWASQNDAGFVLLTDTDMRSGYPLWNIKLMWRYARIELPIDIVWRTQEFMNNNGGKVVFWNLCHALSAKIERPLSYRKFILHMMFHHLIEFDLNLKITDQMTIHLPNKEA